MTTTQDTFTHKVNNKTIFPYSEKRGKKVRVRIRRLYLTLPPITDSGLFRITLRGGKFTVSIVPRGKPQPWFTNPSGRSEVWYLPPTTNDDGEFTYVRTDDEPMTFDEVFVWMKRRGIPDYTIRQLIDRLIRE